MRSGGWRRRGSAVQSGVLAWQQQRDGWLVWPDSEQAGVAGTDTTASGTRFCTWSRPSRARFTMDTLRDTLASASTVPLPACATPSRSLPGDQPAPLL